MRVRTGKEIKARNAVVNGLFSSSSNWVAYRCTRVCADGMATVTKAETEYASCYQDLANLIVGHKYFYMMEMRNVSGITTLRYFFQNSGTGYFSKVVDNPVAGVWYEFVGGGTVTGTTSRIDPQGLGPVGAVYQMRTPLVLDLTESFGSGNEPSPEQFYEMCKNCVSALAAGREITINERAGKVAIGSVSASTDVPPEYKRVLYIRASGGQYIDTGIVPDSSTKIEMLVRTDDPLFRCGISGRGYFHADGYVYKFDGTTGTVSSGIDPSVWKAWVECSVDYSNGKVVMNGVEGVSNISLDGNDKSFYLMNRNGNLVTSGSSGVAYWFKAYRNGTLTSDLIPVVRRSDSKPGMYDRVSGAFFVNGGSGDFTAGPAIDISDEYAEVEYLEATGTQRIYLPTVDYDYIKIACQYKDTETEQCIMGDESSGDTYARR